MEEGRDGGREYLPPLSSRRKGRKKGNLFASLNHLALVLISTHSLCIVDDLFARLYFSLESVFR